MSTNVGVVKILGDNSISMTTSGSFVGLAQAKGTATDLLLTVLVQPNGTGSAYGGSTNLAVQGANVTASSSTTWANVTPDKGAFTVVTATTQAGTIQSVHLQNLQFAFYRVTCSASTSVTANLGTVFQYQPVADSFDATVA